METLLSMQNMDKYYGPVKALDGARLEVLPGEVHALLGANGAGKSTLMKILCGEIGYDGGEITWDGRRLEPGDYGRSTDYGVGMVHQELSVVTELTAAQYIFLGREPVRGFSIDDGRMIEDAGKLLERVGSDIDPSALMGELSPAQQQLVEISRTISYDLRLLVMDEPTTALGDKETEQLFRVIEDLRRSGMAIIYISHRLDEIFRISQRVTVMRDGRYIVTMDTCDTTKSEIVRLLAGRDIDSDRKYASSVPADAETVLEVKGLCTAALLKDISFSLKKGEILGLAGLMGAGRTETARAICGIDPKTSGEIYVNGRKADIRSPKDAADHGICYLSEDRNTEGAVGNRSIIGNTVLSSLNKYERGLSLNDDEMLRDTEQYNSMLNTKYSDPHAPITSLSGGNCQKVLIARWLIRDLPVMIFDEPTQGIDVGAKDEIYGIMHDIADRGHSILMISSETEELLRNCDRILVMSEGRISGEMSIDEASPELIMKYAMGGNNE